MQRCFCEGHDCDLTHEIECVVCREIIHDAQAHRCKTAPQEDK